MGCCTSSPYQKRIYRDPADLDEELVPYRYFGTNRAGSNLVPDDVGGLPSTHLKAHLATNSDLLLYDAEIDHGQAYRFLRLIYFLLFTPCGWVYIIGHGVNKVCSKCTCDEVCCWVRKEYSTRMFFRVYPNRIEVNYPHVRWPYGYLGCGSWNADDILSHPFDRGAFGFSRVNCGVLESLCCLWPVYGGTVARHRCQCNGPLWNRMFTDCGGWWCEEWICKTMCCVYTYRGLAEPDEVAFACSIALQAYFEGRIITKEDMDKCIQFWKDNISELDDPIARKRPVCCEPYMVPCCDMARWYKCDHPVRRMPVPEEEATERMKEVNRAASYWSNTSQPQALTARQQAYSVYESSRLKQIDRYERLHAPLRTSTLCRAGGCRRVFGRKGCFFCTEGCTHFDRQAGEPAPPLEEHDLDDYFDASTVLIEVLGPPPPNVVIRRWRWDPERNENILEVYPEGAPLPEPVEETVAHGKKPHNA